jgi:filamentous hemagglutinin
VKDVSKAGDTAKTADNAKPEGTAGEVTSPGDGVVVKPAGSGSGSSAPDRRLLNELSSQGTKYTPENIVGIGKNPDGQIFFLEKGNSRAGLQHIVEGHGADFARRGITESQIPEAVMEAITRGNVVGLQGRRPIYEVEFNGQIHRIAVTTGDNGFVVGANPAR